MSSFHRLSNYHIAPHFTEKGGELQIGGVGVSQIAEKCGTPLYIYEGQLIRHNALNVIHCLPSFQLAYSLKANPAIGICKLLSELGCWAEIASGGEMLIASTAGFASGRTIFAGPAKQEWEIARAANNGIAIINVESERELRLVNKYSRFKSPQICLRVNTLGTSKNAGEKMVGGPSRFGIDEEELPKLYKKYGKKSRIVGLHVYTGSQILKAGEIVANFDRALRIFNKCKNELGKNLSTLVFGGGFGVPNSIHDPVLDLSAVFQGIEKTLALETAARPSNLFIELGRFLVANAGVFVTRIVDVKKSRGRMFISTDGGMNNFLRPIFMKSEHPVLALDRLGKSEVILANVGGPLCTPLDQYACDVKLPYIKPGNLIGVFNAGAYGYSMSIHSFLGHPSPGEILIDRKKVTCLRRRGSVKSLLLGQRI